MDVKLTHITHKIILLFSVLLSLIVGVLLGRTTQNQGNDIMILLIFAMVFMIAVLLIILLSIITRMEEDFYWHIKKRI